MSIEEGLKKNGYHASTTSGYSMYPLLRDRRDNIVVRPCSGRLKKYDVPLYKHLVLILDTVKEYLPPLLY